MSEKETIHPVVKDWVRLETRRQFLSKGMNALGWAALSALGGAATAPAAYAGGRSRADTPGPHFAPKAKRVIYLHMVGGPPQMDLYDYKPQMQEWYDKDLPDTVRMGQRLTTMTSGQARFPVAPSKYKFERHGRCGMWVTELLPYTAR